MTSFAVAGPAAFVAIALDASIKAAAATAAAAVLARLLRHEPARVRYRVWLGALLVAALALILAPIQAVPAGWQPAAVELPGHAMPTAVSTVLVWTWAFGALANAARAAAGLMALALDRRRLPEASGQAWHHQVRKARIALGLRTRVRVLYGEPDGVPMCWGLFGGTIVVPSAAIAWSHRLRQAVVLHECAHLRRRDPLVMLVEQIVCIALWFNPAVWLIIGRLRRDRELACDEAVVAAGVRPDVYARLLVALARACRPNDSPAHAVVHPCGMQTRVAALLADPPAHARPHHRGLLFSAGVAVALLTLTRVVAIAAPGTQTPSGTAHRATQPGENPASFRAGFFEGDR